MFAIFMVSMLLHVFNGKSVGSQMPVNAATVKYLDLAGGKRLAYEKVEGCGGLPTVVWVPGFGTGMDAEKPLYLRDFCIRRNYTFIRYDPTNIGSSPGSWQTVEFQDWVEDAASILENLGSAQNIVIGHSMGCWISLLLATQERFKNLVHTLILVSPGLYSWQPLYEDLFSRLPQDLQDKLESGEFIQIPDPYLETEMLTLRKSFIENSKSFDIDLSKPVEVTCPVRILHGVEDVIIPYRNSLGLMENLVTKDVELVYRKGAGHWFMEEQSLELIGETLERVVQDQIIDETS